MFASTVIGHPIGVGVGVFVDVAVLLGVGVFVAVLVGVEVDVFVGVGVFVAVDVFVGVGAAPRIKPIFSLKLLPGAKSKNAVGGFGVAR